MQVLQDSNTSSASKASAKVASTATKIDGQAQLPGAVAGVQSLIDAYMKIATRNYEQQISAITALSAVKTPVEFFEVQQNLIRDGIGAAMTDGKVLAELTATAFNSAFAACPVQISAFRNLDRQAA